MKCRTLSRLSGGFYLWWVSLVVSLASGSLSRLSHRDLKLHGEARGRPAANIQSCREARPNTVWLALSLHLWCPRHIPLLRLECKLHRGRVAEAVRKLRVVVFAEDVARHPVEHRPQPADQAGGRPAEMLQLIEDTRRGIIGEDANVFGLCVHVYGVHVYGVHVYGSVHMRGGERERGER